MHMHSNNLGSIRHLANPIDILGTYSYMRELPPYHNIDRYSTLISKCPPFICIIESRHLRMLPLNETRYFYCSVRRKSLSTRIIHNRFINIWFYLANGYWHKLYSILNRHVQAVVEKIEVQLVLSPHQIYYLCAAVQFSCSFS